MKKKKQILTWIIVCLLWETLVVGVHILMRSQLKFPVLNLELFGWLIPVFMAVPFWALLFGIVSVYRKRLMKAFAVVFTVLGVMVYIAYIAFVTLGLAVWEPGLYPLISKTESTADYLVLDGKFAENYDEITEIMPKTIPDDATSIEYNYRYEPGMRGFLSVSWKLPESEYETFKKETLQKDGEITQDSRGTIFKYSWYTDSLPYYNWSQLIFNDERHSISYTLSQYYGS